MIFTISAPWYSSVALLQEKLTVTHQDQGIGSHYMAMGSAPGGNAAPENRQYPSASKLGKESGLSFDAILSSEWWMPACSSRSRVKQSN
jgi:hypothetical protein